MFMLWDLMDGLETIAGGFEGFEKRCNHLAHLRQQEAIKKETEEIAKTLTNNVVKSFTQAP